MFMSQTTPRLKRLPVAILAACASLAVSAAPGPVTVAIQADKSGAEISPTMWGIFFEDINFGADGGLYAELVKNRSFEFPEPLMGWSRVQPLDGGDAVSIQDQTPFAGSNPHYLRLKAADGAPVVIANDGFRGIGLRAGAKYNFSAMTRAAANGPARVQVRLVAADGTILAQQALKSPGKTWAKQTAALFAKATDPKARLEVALEGPGAIDLDMVSLFPDDTWKRRPNGLRADVVQLLADMKPGFMRFPGGCIVEGRQLDTRYQWKTTIGKLEDRKLIINRWNDEFQHRPTPDYFQSFGLGFFEFFQLCEDIGAEPLPILNCGMACQFNTGQLVPIEQLDPYIQDALDLVEFANGPVESTWGKKRAEMGHPAPFHMKFLGVGNEQWGPQYIERYTRFAEALKRAYPEIKLVSSAGPGPADDNFKFAWPKLRELKADIIDEHCYSRPDWFLDNTARYDQYDRRGPKVFMGEYAAQSVKTVSPENRNDWECALAEAAYMIGLERNADVVTMASYAPLSAHVDAWQWTPNLIWFDNLRAFGTPSYYVQQVFSRNRGDVLLPTEVKGALAAANGQPRFYASASRDRKSGEVILKLVNATAAPVPVHVDLTGLRGLNAKANATILSAPNLAAENNLKEPRAVAPRQETLTGLERSFDHTFPPSSLTVVRFDTKLRAF